MTRGIKREGLCRGRKFTTHITTSYHSRAPRARAKMSQPKAALPDARVRQEAQQTLSAWAEKNHRGRAWRTGCRRRWFVMHGFHICYYADEKTAGQAAAILTVAAYYGYTNYGEPTVGRRPRVAANPSLLALALTPAARHVRPTQRARPPQLARRLRSRWRHRRRPLREERRQLEESCHGGAPCGGEGALASSHVLRRIGRRAAAGDASVPQRGAGDGAGRQLCDTEDCELDLWRHARAAHAA